MKVCCLFLGAILADAAQNVGMCIDVGTGRLSGELKWVGVTWGSLWAWGRIQVQEFIGMAQGRGFHAGAGDMWWSHWACV